MVMNVTSRLTSPQGETIVDKGPERMLEENTMALEYYFGGRFSDSHVEDKYIACVYDVGRELFGELIGKFFSYHLSVEAKKNLLDASPNPVEANVK